MHDPKCFVFRLYTQNLSLKAVFKWKFFQISSVTGKNKLYFFVFSFCTISVQKILFFFFFFPEFSKTVQEQCKSVK